MQRVNILAFILLAIVFAADGKRLVISGPIGEGAFVDRADIEEVVVVEGCGVTEIPDYAFLGCTSLKRVHLSADIRKIGYQAFAECDSLAEINLPDALEDIGSNSFAYCRSLGNLTFPDGLTHIGHNAFSFCTSLTRVWLPDSLKEIESYAFSDCDSLREVRLPANDRLLGELMFNCCRSLAVVVEPSVKVPPFDCDSYIFDPDDKEAYRKCELRVPAESAASYRRSPSWSLFDTILPLK